jgi:NDP-sugar pyrophosphorylase family protein
MNASSHNMPPLALLAGGLGTRLGGLAAQIPKALIEVAGKPFLAHQLELLVSQGIREVVICCGHLGEAIEEFAGDGHDFGCRIQYSHDGLELLGTGGAIRNALPLLGSEFWVMYGDTYLTAEFVTVLDTFRKEQKPTCMAVLRNENRWDTSNVEFADGSLIRYSKQQRTPAMRHIDYGLNLFSAEAFRNWKDIRTFDLSQLQEQLTEQGKMAACEVHERFYEIGTPSALRETEDFLQSLEVRA